MRTCLRSAVCLVTLLLLPACTYIEKQEASDTEATLAAAGFVMKPADTPEKMARLKAMPARTIVTRTKDGAPVYLYADPDFCQCLYAGGPDQYARYQRLALEKQIAAERVEAAEMNEDAAMDWGLWGPFW